jgi:Na+:H+ antiporter, NhaA family
MDRGSLAEITMEAYDSAAPAAHQSNRTDLLGGIALGLATIAALAVANSPFGPQYTALLDMVGEVRIGPAVLSKNLEHWINDGLMALFFLLVGLEIKREVLQGSLASRQKAVLPIVGAVGGFLVPPLIYAAINWNDPQALRGWAIASTTDIAFVVGICAILGRAVPGSLKAFLLALAVIDDLLAIIVIAVFYTDELSILSLELAFLGLAALLTLNVLNVQKATPFVLVGVYTWVCVLKSGVHATLAGVAVGLAMPLRGNPGESLLERTEHALRPWVAYAIVPLFAFVNAGVSLSGISPASLLTSVPLGIIAGLFVGKQAGVFLASTAAVKLRWAELPSGTTTLQLYGGSILTGIGFTMSLFVGTLAFHDDRILEQIRLAVLAASALTALAGGIFLLSAKTR